ncbi:MAG: hypothetical protein V1886_01240 [archaeon]
MKTISIMLLNAILILAFPVGMLIAKATKEELKQGRKVFIILIAISLLSILVSFLMGIRNDNLTILSYTAMFIAIISALSLKGACTK